MQQAGSKRSPGENREDFSTVLKPIDALKSLSGVKK
jgi:hypothetical protein